MQSFTARVSRIDDLTHDVRVLRLALEEPEAIAFAPGQFVSIKVPRLDAPAVVTRAYSIASPPVQDHAIDLLFNLVPNGPGSTFLYSRRAGDEVRFKGPAGTFVLQPYPDRDLLFVATGTGIAPFRSMIQARLAGEPARRVGLIWGLRSERDLYYQDELRSLAAAYPQFSYVVTLSQPSPDWHGARGRVQRVVEAHVRSVESLAVYICGSSQMIADVSALIRQRGLCPIHREQYYRDDAEG